MMKKISNVFMALVTLSLMIISCNKESTTTDQAIVSQTTHELGALLLQPEVYAQIPVAETPIVDFRLRSEVTVPLMPVGNQGGEGSCVAFGTTYAARSIDWYTKSGATTWTQSTDIFSPEYVYNQIKVRKQCSSGAYVTSGLNLLKSQGVCRWSLMPYTDVNCNTMPNGTQKADAANYKIGGYSTCTINTATIKSFLAAGKPVIVAGPVNMAFEYLGNGAVLATFTGSSLGGHCYCVVGYDDTKGAFKFQNSWGTGWASAGFGWIAYGYETTWWKEAYVIN